MDVAGGARARARAVDAARTRRSAGSPRLCATSARVWSKGRGASGGRRRRGGARATRNRRSDDAKTESETKKRKKRVGRSPRHPRVSARARAAPSPRTKNCLVAVAVRRRGFLDAGEAAAAEEKNVPADAVQRPRKPPPRRRRRRRGRLARPRPRRWPRVTRARRTIERNAPVLVESSASGIQRGGRVPRGARRGADADKKRSDDDDAGQKTNARSVWAHRARSPARVERRTKTPRTKGATAPGRVRAFQRRETDRLARSRRAGRTGGVQVERSAERPPPRSPPAPRGGGRRRRRNCASTALADAEVDVRLEEALRRAADADGFEEELAARGEHRRRSPAKTKYYKVMYGV